MNPRNSFNSWTMKTASLLSLSAVTIIIGLPALAGPTGGDNTSGQSYGLSITDRGTNRETARDTDQSRELRDILWRDSLETLNK